MHYMYTSNQVTYINRGTRIMKKEQILIIVGMLVMISLLPIIEADDQTKQNNELLHHVYILTKVN